MADPSFRQAGASDQDAVVRLTTAAYAPYTALFGYPPLPVTEDYAPRIAQGEVWLLDAMAELVGLLVMEPAEDHGLIFSVAVSPDHQGRGYGVKLLDFAEARTRSMGFSEIRLYTNARMERNIALYAAHGYAETGRRPNPKRPGWTIVDMAKPLPQG